LQLQLWCKYTSSNFLRHSNKWKRALGPSTPKAKSLRDNTFHHPTLQQHLKSLPLWHSHLLYNHQQISTDIEVWQMFRSQKWLTIVSKGILWEEAGTFGWKLTMPTHKVLFHGYGPVDGTNKTESCIRSKIGGHTAPFLLVRTLARHWGLRHRCKLRWLAESKAVFNQGWMVIQKDLSPTKQPDNSDYPSTIKDLFCKLQQPMTTNLCLNDTLEMAIEEQMQIDWLQLLLG
jgi:hypothetical protein